MHVRKPAALAVAVVAAAAASAVIAVPALAGTGAAAATHTLNFTATQIASHSYTGVYGYEIDKDVYKGKVIAGDIVDSVSADQEDVTLALSDGFLYATFTVNSKGAFSGKVTGGTGAYKGDSGTIQGQVTNSSGTAANVTVTYH